MRIARYLALGVMAAGAAWGQVIIQPRQITAPLAAPAAPPSQQAPPSPKVAPSKQAEAPSAKHTESKAAPKAAEKPAAKPGASHTAASTASKPAAADEQSATKKATPAKSPEASKSAAKPKPEAGAKAAQVKSPMKPKMSSRPAPPVRPVAQKAAAKPAAKPAAAAAQAPVQAAARPPRARRDPFISPIVEARPESGPNCETGKKCLAVNQITLRGVVKSQEGMIAVVENRRNVTYFLRENDPVFNGYVVKITGDSVIFRENTLDSMGRVGTRDVTLKVNAPVV